MLAHYILLEFGFVKYSCTWSNEKLIVSRIYLTISSNTVWDMLLISLRKNIGLSIKVVKYSHWVISRCF